MEDKAVQGSTLQGREWHVSAELDKAKVYPSNDTHRYSEWPALVIEMGGYSDLTAIDPYSGRRFWVSDAFRCDEHSQALAKAEPGDESVAIMKQAHECEGCHGSIVTAIRRLLDAMEVAGFPDAFRNEITAGGNPTPATATT